MSIEQELAALRRMTTGELARRFEELHGQPARSRNREYLVRKVAWRTQALAEGDLSERSRMRAAELANDADVRVMPPRNADPPSSDGPRAVAPVSRDPRLPAPGGAITRQYKGRTIRVVVLPKGFEWEGRRFRTLSAVAKAVSGTHTSGWRFFGLQEDRK